MGHSGVVVSYWLVVGSWYGRGRGHTEPTLGNGGLLRALLDGGLFYERGERPYLALWRGWFGGADRGFLEF